MTHLAMVKAAIGILFATVAFATSSAVGASAAAAAIAAIGSVVAAIISRRLLTKVQEVHVLVNSQLTDVMSKLAAMTRERDELAPERAGEDPKVEVEADPDKKDIQNGS